MKKVERADVLTVHCVSIPCFQLQKLRDASSDSCEHSFNSVLKIKFLVAPAPCNFTVLQLQSQGSSWQKSEEEHTLYYTVRAT